MAIVKREKQIAECELCEKYVPMDYDPFKNGHMFLCVRCKGVFCEDHSVFVQVRSHSPDYKREFIRRDARLCVKCSKALGDSLEEFGMLERQIEEEGGN